MTSRINANEESFSFTIIRDEAFVRGLEKWLSPTFTAKPRDGMQRVI
jgi:hypothetical protein